ncbi:MAG: T9SS type A sorting domain-containing protein [Chitinophagales bacterium]|nr:T9SS type A sorting domain-containing protein [Chitinophagales bacterium]
MWKRGILGICLAMAFSLLCSFTYVEKYYGAAQSYEEGVSVLPLPNGNYLVSGAYNNTGNLANWKGYLLLLDAQGDTLWAQRDLPVNGKIRPTSDDNFIFAGGNTAAQAYDTIYISKATQQGQPIWSKQFMIGPCKNTVTDVLPIADGYLISGFFATKIAASPTYDAFVMKLNLTGDIVWQQTVGGDFTEQLHSVKVLPNGQVVALGWTNSDNSTNNVDYLLVKLEADGTPVWRKRFGNEYHNYGYGLEVTNDGRMVTLGYTSHMEFTKLDSSGKILWEKTYGSTGGSTYFKVANTMDGGFALLGTEMVGSQSQAVFMKIKQNGEVFWKKSWNARLREFQEKADGSFVLTGYASYLPDVVVIMMDSTLLPAPMPTITKPDMLASVPDSAASLAAPEEDEDAAAQQLLDSLGISTAVDEQALETKYGSVKTYPNPADNEVFIEYPNADNREFSIQVFAMNGATVRYADHLVGDKITIERGDLAKGMYTYKLSDGRNTYIGKILFR